MNHLKFLAVAAAASFLATSCSNDELSMPSDSGVTYTLELPGDLATRADEFGNDNGLQAVNLTYAVYDADGNFVDGKTIDNFFNGSTLSNTLSLDLVNGETYNIVFWADSGTDAYEFSQSNATVTVKYDKVCSNDDAFDAFYGNDKEYTVKGAVNRKVTLTRPFAQINLGTSDLSNAAVIAAFGQNHANLQTEISLNVANSLNLLEGTVEGDATYTKACGIPNPAKNFPSVAGYTGPALEYLSMNYVLVGNGRTLKDLSFTVSNSSTAKVFNTISIPSAPLQANFRTNIYGKLLTSTTEYTVDINPIFTDPGYNVSVWDGSTADPVEDVTAKTLTINNAAQLAGFAKNVNAGNTYAGYTVTLTSDIDLNNMAWSPIGPNSDAPARFAGTFDGNGYTISGLNVNKAGVYESAGLFGSIQGTVRNVKIDKATISLNSSGEYSDNGAGFIAGAIYQSGLIEGCTVTNSTLNCNRYGGGIVGYSYGSANGNTVEGCSISATLAAANEDLNDKVGGIVGYSGEGSMTFNGNTVRNCVILGYRNVGGIAGTINSGVTVTGNTLQDVTINWTSPSGTANSDGSGQSNGEVVGRRLGSTTVDNNSTNGVTLGGVTQVNGYPGLVKDSDNTLHVGTAAALASLNKYITDKGFTTPLSETMVLDADIDAAGLTWKGSFKADSHPFTFDGNGHTIANLNIVGGFFTGVGGSSNKNAEVKNITFSNCKTTGTWHAGTVWGNMYGNVVFTNVNVINCKVNANSAAGGIIGVYGEGNGSTYGATFNGCSVKNTVITANGTEATKAGASQFVGLVDYFIANESSGKNPVVYGTKYIRFGEGNSVSNNTCNNPEGMLGGGIYTIGYLKNEGGVSNITSGLSVVSEFQDGSITEPANP